MRQVALIGLSPSGREAPKDWERWGLAHDLRSWRCDRVFEFHDLSEAGQDTKALIKERLALAREAGCRIVMRDDFPLAAVEEIWPYGFDSSIAYMLALALLECVPRIGLWGVDQASDEEYGWA